MCKVDMGLGFNGLGSRVSGSEKVGLWRFKVWMFEGACRLRFTVQVWVGDFYRAFRLLCSIQRSFAPSCKRRRP